MRAAIFLDRDGTLVETRHYPSRPEDFVLYEGLGAELKALQHAGFLLVLITNQSGLARGYFGWAELERMHETLLATLHRQGVTIDGIYVCPHHPEGTIGELAIECDCRKPQPGLLLRAARELDLDLQASWFIGDILDDVQAGHLAGCRSVLLDVGHETEWRMTPEREPDRCAGDLYEAARLVLNAMANDAAARGS